MNINLSLPARKVVYPSKTTLNLCFKEKNPLRLTLVIPLVIAVLVAAALFAKFGVLDRLDRMERMEHEITSLQSQRDGLAASLADYNEVTEQYSRYSVGWMNEQETSLVPSSDMLDLVEKELMRAGRVTRISINGNVISASIANLSLDQTSKLVETLYARDDIVNVTVSSASANADTGVNDSVAMTVTVKLPEGGEAE